MTQTHGLIKLEQHWPLPLGPEPVERVPRGPDGPRSASRGIWTGSHLRQKGPEGDTMYPSSSTLASLLTADNTQVYIPCHRFSY